MVATSKDVAELAGVSQSTVSYVMSGSRPISAGTRERVEAAMRQLAYEPNASARALAGRRTSVIGLVLQLSGGVQMAGAMPFIDTVTALARQRDYDVVLVTADEGAAGIERLTRRAVVDALVVMDIDKDDQRLPILETVDVPSVLIGRPNHSERFSCVDYDSEQAGAIAAEELCANGASEILLLGEAPESSGRIPNTIALFERGARRVAQQHGRSVRFLDEAYWDGRVARRLAAEAQGWQDERTGVLARTPQAIDAVLQAFLIAHIGDTEIPFVGLCTDDYADTLRMPITNVSPEPREVSRLAMTAVFTQLDQGQTLADVQLVEPRVTRRQN